MEAMCGNEQMACKAQSQNDIDDVEEFNYSKGYDKDTRVKTKGLDGKWYLGTVVVGDKKTNMYNPPVFVADDKKAYNEANDMDSDYFKSVYNSGINSLFQTIYSCEEMVCSAGEYLSKKESTKNFWRSGKEIIENASENLYKNMLEESPYPEVFKFYNTVFDVASIVYGGIGIVKSIASIPKLFTKGKKVVGIVQKSVSITEDFAIGSGGAATLGGTRSISIAPGIIGEIADAISVSGSGAVELTDSGVMAATGIYNMSGSPGGNDGGSNSNVVTKTNKKGNIVTEYTNNSSNTVRMIEQRPKDIESSIETKLKSNDLGAQIEGKVGKYINENTSCEITAFAQPVEKIKPKGPPAGDVDVATNKYIIEVKKSTKAIKIKQIDKYVNSSNPDYFNYEGKQIVFYIDEPIDMSNKYTAEMIKNMENSGVKVVNSLEELKGVIES